MLTSRKIKNIINLILAILIVIAIFAVRGNYILFWGIVLAIYASQWGLFKWLEKR